MNLQDAMKHARFYIDAKIPVALWGAPGIGKSEGVEQLAAEMDDCAVHIEALNLYESVDMRGLPRDIDGNVVWSVPEMFQKVRLLASQHRQVLLFADEWNTSVGSVLITWAQLVRLGRIGPHILPSNVSVIMAGNRQSDRAAANRVPSMLLNRMAHLDVEPHEPTWIAWAERAGVNPIVVAYIAFRNSDHNKKANVLHNMDGGKDLRAYPTPRTWVEVAKIVHAPDDLRPALAAGLVGANAASDFESFLQSWRHVPRLADILADPENYDVPGEDKPGVLFATSVMLAKNMTRQNIDKIITYVERMPEDVGVPCIIEATKRDSSLMKTQAFILWAARNQDIVV